MKKAIAFCLAVLVAGPFGLEAQNKLVKRLKQSSIIDNKSKQNSSQTAPTATNSRPGRSVNYYWDDQSSQWVYSDSSFYAYTLSGDLSSEILRNGIPNARYLTTYDAQGHITQQVSQFWDGFLNTWQNISRSTYQFNNQGYMTQNLFENYNTTTNQWEMQFGSKNVLTYDVSNRITDNIYQSWNSTTNNWKNDYRETAFTYDANNNVLTLESKIPNGANWDNDYKYALVYALNNQPVQLTMQTWNGTMYENDARWINLIFQNWCGWYCDNIAIQSGTIQYWGNPQTNQWNNTERLSSVYDAFGGYVETWQNYTGSVWENSWRYTQSYDNSSNYTGYKSESWNTVNSTWETQYENKQLHTYDFSMNIGQTIWQYWDSFTMSLESTHKKVYGNFTYVGLNESLIDQSSIRVFPNPCSGDCVIEIREDLIQEGDVTKEFVIYDTQGKPVHKELVTSSKSSFTTGNFPKGIYFYQINTQGKILKSGKLIVE